MGSRTNIVPSGIDFDKEINEFKKFVSYAISQVTSQNSEITGLGGDDFFLKNKSGIKIKLLTRY